MLLESLVAKAKKAGADEAEIFYSSSRGTSVEVLNREAEAVDSLENRGIGIRVIKGKRLGFAYTSNFERIDETIEQAVKNARDASPDEFNALPKHKSIAPMSEKLFDEELNRVSTPEKIKFALKMEEAAFAHDRRVKKTDKIGFSDSEYAIEIINSNGLHLKYRGNHCGGSADVIAEADNEAESGFGFDANLKWSKLDAEKIGREAAINACLCLGGSAIPAQKIAAALNPYMSAQILGIIAGMASADAVQKGKSLFAGKLGQAAASACVTIEDDGRLKEAIGTAPFDGEGVPTRKTVIIENGVLKSFLYNTYTAAKDKVKSTGNASRGYSSTPAIGPTNLFIRPGEKTEEAMLKLYPKILYVTRMMGLHTINPISGDFSVGAIGGLYQNGERVQAVRGITVAGNLISLLKKIEAVGSNIRFFGSIGAPSILISEISVSG